MPGDRDLWDQAQILAQVVLAITGPVFTFVFSQTNARAQKLQLQASLIDKLTDADETRRRIGLLLAQEIDPMFAAQAASALVTHDANPEVRRGARSILRSLVREGESEAGKLAAEILNRKGLAIELEEKNLADLITQARDHARMQSAHGREEALRLYQEVVAQLSSKARGDLDQKLLGEAQAAHREGHLDASLKAYEQVFSSHR